MVHFADTQGRSMPHTPDAFSSLTTPGDSLMESLVLNEPSVNVNATDAIDLDNISTKAQLPRRRTGLLGIPEAENFDWLSTAISAPANTVVGGQGGSKRSSIVGAAANEESTRPTSFHSLDLLEAIRDSVAMFGLYNPGVLIPSLVSNSWQDSIGNADADQTMSDNEDVPMTDSQDAATTNPDPDDFDVAEKGAFQRWTAADLASFLQVNVSTCGLLWITSKAAFLDDNPDLTLVDLRAIEENQVKWVALESQLEEHAQKEVRNTHVDAGLEKCVFEHAE